MTDFAGQLVTVEGYAASPSDDALMMLVGAVDHVVTDRGGTLIEFPDWDEE